MNESTVRINDAILLARLHKALIFIRDNRVRIKQERINHYLYVANKRNFKRSKRWWSFLIPKKFKTPVGEDSLSLKVHEKLTCKWGDIDRLQELQKLCKTGFAVTLTTTDMNSLMIGENANKWKSGATIRTRKDIEAIWS